MVKLVSAETKREWREYKEKMKTDAEFKKAELIKRRARAKTRDKDKERELREAERAKKRRLAPQVSDTSEDAVA